MSSPSFSGLGWRSWGVLAAALLLAGCAGPDSPIVSNADYSCVSDSLECINRRQNTLRQLTSDRERKWMKDPASPEAYASGVRLFAMKTKKKELSCDELNKGRQEADGASNALRGPGGAKLTTAQISRGTLFASEVSRELVNEFNRRCKKA